MKGDFTRFTHQPRKGYSQVRKQQGRVELDADWNEQIDIQNYLARTAAIDLIGARGAPKQGGGFAISVAAPAGEDLLIGTGRLYVDGILAELLPGSSLPLTAFPANGQVTLATGAVDGMPFAAGQYVELSAQGLPPATLRIAALGPGENDLTLDGNTAAFHSSATRLRRLSSYLTQPVYPGAAALDLPEDGGSRTDLLYLDVWERHITAIEDPDIREVALGGPDTATRVQTVAQVRLLAGVGNVSCDDASAGLPQPGDGRLTTAATAPPASDDPCVIAPGGGYRGLENRLYRVEIHDGSDGGAATFKWSRDNGAVLFAVEAFIPGEPEKVRVRQLGRDQVLALHKDSWVEVLDDDTELAGEPGILAQITDIDEAQRILTLSKPVTGFTVSGRARVRRWDMAGDAIPVAAGPIALEEGIEVSFSGNDFRSGDYWTFAARTVIANGQSGISELDEAPPQGIAHHYCPLALVTWSFDGANWLATVEDCRPSFPALTEICAEDICFDNSTCGLPGSETVQDALDQLCRANDLRHHNKHLHGWGIVCGLQVECGPDEGEGGRRHVTVRDGYAIDCDGNDLIVEDDETIVVDVLEAIAVLDEENPGEPVLNDNGDGEVCLYLDGEGGQVGVVVDRYDPSHNDLQSLLSGTLLMDFFQDCIQPLIDFIQLEMAVQGDEESPLVSPAQERFITLLNLLAMLYSPAYGRYVFTSQKEHDIIQGIYDGLRALLQSKTYCAMFDNARPFPDYPFPDHRTSTIFGKRYHGRLRLHPTRPLGYTVGLNNILHVYDLEAETMVAEVEVPGGSGIVVRDVAFSAEGDQVYAIATQQGTNTVFAVADLSDLEHKWRPVTVICDVVLLALATARDISGDVYAVGREEGPGAGTANQGFFVINPDNVNPDLKPASNFNPVGHLVISPETKVAYASASRQAGVQTSYDHVLAIQLPDGAVAGEYPLSAAGAAVAGSDDIAVAVDRESDQIWLFVVVDKQPNGKGKLLLRYQASQPGPPNAQTDLEENTEIRLGHVADSPYLLATYEDLFRLRLVQMAEPVLIPEYVLALQLMPLALAYQPELKQVYALNVISSTLTAIPQEYLDPEDGPGVAPPPGSEEYLETLAGYRQAIFDAFIDLTGGLLQYLKDCLCDHFLVNCPECDTGEEIYLACVSVRGGQVDKVCNFSRRRYVKSFPTVGYWLSLVPIAPFIDRAVEEFCCLVLPGLFSKATAPAANAYQAPVTGLQMRSGLATAMTTDFRGMLSSRIGQVRLGRQVATDFVGQRLAARPAVVAPPPSTGLRQNDLAGRPVEDATRRLEEANVTVESVEAYDPTRVTTNLRRLATTPPRVPPGARVKLYTEGDTVRFYEVVSAERVAPAGPVAGPAEVEALRTSLEEVRSELQTRDQEIAGLRTQLQTLEARQAEAGMEAAAERINQLEAGLGELRELRQEVRRFLDRNG
jgi:hypothetical protein